MVVEAGVPSPPTTDLVAGEEPMEIRIAVGRRRVRVAVTMRTPGADFELAAGFLYAEGIITSRDQVLQIRYCSDRGVNAEDRFNIVTVYLRDVVATEMERLDRHFHVSSACGVCGKARLEDIASRGCVPVRATWTVSPETIQGLPDRLRSTQALFDRTGGLHAAALFDSTGVLLAVREDVGRHNALDKLIGWALLAGHLALDRCILLVSGRASFELLQKAAVAAVPIFCAVSAPSSLAVDTAETFGITLVGFLRGQRFNIYSHPARLLVGAAAP